MGMFVFPFSKELYQVYHKNNPHHLLMKDRLIRIIISAYNYLCVYRLWLDIKLLHFHVI